MDLKRLLAALTKQADEVDVNKVIKTLAKESDDAIAPLGSGKNLEALQKARAAARSGEVPSYPKNITQDDLAARGDFTLVGEPMTKDFTMPHPEARLPVLSKGTDASTEVLRPVSKDMVPFSKKPDIDVTPSSAKLLDQVKGAAKKDPEGWSKARLGGAAAIAAFLGSQMMGGDGGDNIQIPMAKEKEAPGEQKKVEAKIAEDVKTAKTPTVDNKIEPLTEKKEEKPAEVEKAPSEDLDFLKLYKEGVAQSEEERSMANLVRGSENLGYGIARLTPDHTSSDRMHKDADRKIEQAKGKIGSIKEQQSYDKAKEELNDDNKMRDPNSEVSKLTSEIAAKAGLIKPGTSMSAMALKNSGVNLGVLLSTIEAGKARREAAQIAKDEKQARAADVDKLKIQQSVDKQTTQLFKSKDYEAYNAAKDADYNLSQAIESGNKTDAGTAFMTFAKIAQGDNSVVRDGDMAQLAGRMNYTSPSEMISKLAARARGGNFNATELQAMQAITKRVQEIKGHRVQQLLTPIMKRSDAAGLDLSETLDPRMVEEFQGRTVNPEDKSGGGAPAGKPMKLQSPKTPGSIITTKSGKTYKVNADGKTATEQ